MSHKKRHIEKQLADVIMRFCVVSRYYENTEKKRVDFIMNELLDLATKEHFITLRINNNSKMPMKDIY